MGTPLHLPATNELKALCLQAQSSRDGAKGRTITFSPKVFIPLTRLCRDACGYCVFRQTPQTADRLYMSPEEVLDTARKGEAAGCREALFVLGERPERRFPEARRWLRERGYESTVAYLREMCALVLAETRLFPHSNPGALTTAELASLKPVNASMGLMLESVSARLDGPGGPHEHAPSKRPAVRVRTIDSAGRLKIPWTTGLLVGIGETRQERIDSLLEIRRLHQLHGHIQEVIIQNFRAKPGTPMAAATEASQTEMMETVALARLILGPEMNIQVPPNLQEAYWEFLDAGINDWGGISPVTRDYVNPEAAWPHLGEIRGKVEDGGYRLRARFPVYPEFFLEEDRFVPADLRRRLLLEANGKGLHEATELWNGVSRPRIQRTPSTFQAAP